MRSTIAAFALLSACNGSTPARVFTVLAGDGGGFVTLGSPCTPAIENDPTFSGFSAGEMSVESEPTMTPGDPVCVAFHFQGRVSCPYGQGAPGDAGVATCDTPQGSPVVVGVPPQCLDRRAENVVVWSCQCGGGPLPEGGAYCDCPSGTTCSQTGSGSFCLPSGTTATVSCASVCEAGVHPCD